MIKGSISKPIETEPLEPEERMHPQAVEEAVPSPCKFHKLLLLTWYLING